MWRCLVRGRSHWKYRRRRWERLLRSFCTKKHKWTGGWRSGLAITVTGSEEAHLELLGWWNYNSSTFPRIFSVARYVQAMQGRSVASKSRLLWVRSLITIISSRWKKTKLLHISALAAEAKLQIACGSSGHAANASKNMATALCNEVAQSTWLWLINSAVTPPLMAIRISDMTEVWDRNAWTGSIYWKLEYSGWVWSRARAYWLP